jgi:predicted HTH domain antitoxin
MSSEAAELHVTLPPNLSADEARLLLAIKAYEVGKASAGQAAEVAGVSKRTFLELLGHYHVPVFDTPAGELAEETGG